MDKFSVRSGFSPKRNILQIDSIDDALRNRLWSVLCICFWEKVKGYNFMDYTVERSLSYRLTELDSVKILIRSLWFSHFKRPLDELSGFWQADYNFIKERFFQYSWYEVYDFLEFIASDYLNGSKIEEFTALCNDVFEQEMSGYRFIGSTITPITSSIEIQMIEEALASEGNLAPVSNHINTALIYLSKKENPDYRNSIKESISAVESMCCLIVADDKATLGKALKVISKEQKVELHPALSGAFNQLYGYTSDSNGIRHALLDEPDLDFEDAKFMLVSCSAFVNYLKGKSIKAGLDLDNPDV